jgi:hypothetical protein
MDLDSLEDTLEQKCKRAQYPAQEKLKRWASAHGLTTLDGTHWYHGTALVVVEDNMLRRGVTSIFHNSLTAGHPGITKTLHLLSQYYWWPNMKHNVTEYIKGCATCQMTKVNTWPTHPPLYLITPAENAKPFKTIAMDFIVKLPPSGGYKASFFILCNETIDSEGVANLYLTHVVPHYGTPKKIISDRDLRFTLRFGQALCKSLDI